MINNDIIISMGKGEVTPLSLLDLSAAFDTIDNATLKDRLSNWYGSNLVFYFFEK